MVRCSVCNAENEVGAESCSECGLKMNRLSLFDEYFQMLIAIKKTSESAEESAKAAKWAAVGAVIVGIIGWLIAIV